MTNQSGIVMINHNAKGFLNWMDLVSFFLFLFSCCYDAALAFASVLGVYSSLVSLEGLGH